MSPDRAVRAHYESGTQASEALAEVEGILATLGAPPSAEALAALDQFHLGGLPATRRLAELAAPAAEDEVLDAGSGLGGPSRYLAVAHGCRVTGVDLSPRSSWPSRSCSRRGPGCPAGCATRSATCWTYASRRRASTWSGRNMR